MTFRPLLYCPSSSTTLLPAAKLADYGDEWYRLPEYSRPNMMF